MTDLEMFLAFYRRIGVELKPVNDWEGKNILFRFGEDIYGDYEIVDFEKFDGYGGFYSDIEFTEKGDFVRQGFWE